MSTAAQPMAVLADPGSSMSQVMAAVDEVERTAPPERQVTIGVSSNVTVDLLGVYLRRHALLNGTRLVVRMGNYDDPVGDLERFERQGVEHVVLLPFFDNLHPSFEAQAQHLDEPAIVEREAAFAARFSMVFERAKSLKSVFVASLHRMSDATDDADRTGPVVARFDQALRKAAEPFANIRFIDSEEILLTLGRAQSFDPRFYYKGKAPYTARFFDHLARRVSSASRGFGAWFYKALVLDCDNTLWGGIIGEDLLDGIRLGPHDYPGNVYWRIQHELVALERAGVLLCLCTKNNPADVDEVFTQHRDMVLQDRHIILKKANWDDKVSNLRSIATTLNIGLESLVFLDDSSFEIEAVRAQLPMVRTFQVPPQLSDYGRVMAEIKNLFLAGGVTAESKSKTEQYRKIAQAESARESFGSNEEFLASLDLRVEVSRNERGSIPRISELTQKSNQFNVTTRRYSVAEITHLMDDAGSTVYSMVVSDKHGKAGLTGVLIMRWKGSDAVVDSFLMSCRVIGRGIEYSVWNEVVRDAIAKGCTTLRAEFHRTAKNGQVADFFDRLGLKVIDQDENTKKYEQSTKSFVTPPAPWLEVSTV